MKYIFFYLFMFLLLSKSMAQVSVPDYGFNGPWSRTIKKKTADIPKIQAPVYNNDSLNEAFNGNNGKLDIYALGKRVNISPDSHGEWQMLPDGRKIWQLKIESPTATGFQFVCSHFFMPRGVLLYFYDEKGKRQYGAYNEGNNRKDGKFSSGALLANSLVIELNIPADVPNDAILFKISELAYVFKNPFAISRNFKSNNPLNPREDFGDAYDCIPDVQCSPWKEEWCDEMRAVVRLSVKKVEDGNEDRITWGSGTGAIINSSAETGNYSYEPYILTALHVTANVWIGNTKFVAANPEDWVVHYNFQSPTCERVIGNDQMYSMGVEIVANYGDPDPKQYTSDDDKCPDMSLIRLLEPMPFHYNIFYAGWMIKSFDELDNKDITIIHHPSGDIKKVTSAKINEVTKNNNEGCWRAKNVMGTTMGGSSGSPWFHNESHRIIGTHSVGPDNDVNCGATSEVYQGGSLRRAWAMGLKNYIGQHAGMDGVDPFRDCNGGVNYMELNGDIYPGLDWQTKNEILVQAGISIKAPTISGKTVWVKSSPSYMTNIHNADYTFRANQTITLKEGFKVERGNKFRAEIGNCNTWDDGCGTNYARPIFPSDDLTFEEEKRQGFGIAPNPTTGQLSISMPEAGGVISVYDALGRLCLQEKTTDAVFETNISHLQTGIYLVQWRLGKEIRTQKLVLR